MSLRSTWNDIPKTFAEHSTGTDPCKQSEAQVQTTTRADKDVQTDEKQLAAPSGAANQPGLQGFVARYAERLTCGAPKLPYA